MLSCGKAKDDKGTEASSAASVNNQRKRYCFAIGTKEERVMKTNSDVSVTVVGGGSGVGITAMIDGTTDIAMASRD
jgi:phosphate transport system substrate-binding protein